MGCARAASCELSGVAGIRWTWGVGGGGASGGVGGGDAAALTEVTGEAETTGDIEVAAVTDVPG